MSDIPKPKISPAFTLEDIRKIRDWNHERRNVMTPQEFRECRRKNAERFLARLKTSVDQEKVAEFKRQMAAVLEKRKKAS